MVDVRLRLIFTTRLFVRCLGLWCRSNATGLVSAEIFAGKAEASALTSSESLSRGHKKLLAELYSAPLDELRSSQLAAPQLAALDRKRTRSGEPDAQASVEAA